jgi:2-methylisocitrate lyase-like PEP mutase family enzyme
MANRSRELEETARLVIECGVVGVNVEDSHCAGGLRPVAEQCRRIAAFRKVADRLDVPLVINARIDSFIPALISGSTDAAETAASIDEAATRAVDYAAAGADCIYPIGVRDESTIRALRDRIHVPLNILATPTAAPLAVLQSIGVNRVSFGPKIFGACLQRFVEIADTLQTTGDYACLSPAISPGDFRKYLRSGRE